jgi:thiamine pyrophosphokinase
MKCIELVRARDPAIQSTNALTAIATNATSKSPVASSTVSMVPGHSTQEERQASNYGIVALGGTGGRFDQSMSSIHHLYILNQERQATLISDESIIVVLGAVSFFLADVRRLQHFDPIDSTSNTLFKQPFFFLRRKILL